MLKNDLVDGRLQTEAVKNCDQLPVVEGMGAVVDDRMFRIEISPIRNQAQSEVDQSAQADPPSHNEEDSIVMNERFIDCQEAEQDEHEACRRDAVDAEGLSVSELMCTNMIESHGFSREN